MITSRTSRVLTALLACAVVASCKGGGTPPTGTGTIQVLISPSSVALLPGGHATLHAVVTGPPGVSQHVTWRSFNTDIATITSAGVVTAVSEGAATIRASWQPDPDEFSVIIVQVTLVQIPDAIRAQPVVGVKALPAAREPRRP